MPDRMLIMPSEQDYRGVISDTRVAGAASAVACCVTPTRVFLLKLSCCFQSADRSAEAQMIVRSDDSNKQLCSRNFPGVS